MATDKNLYQILGLDPSASDDAIRRRYRELARQLHPDLTGGEVRAGVTMAEVNEAWSTLSDRQRRRAYDASLIDRPRHGSAAASSDTGVHHADMRFRTEVPLAPRARFPWKAMSAFVVIGMVLILVLHQFSDPPAPGVPDQLLEPGSCVVINPQGLAVEVSCAAEHEFVVSRFIPSDRSCPMDTRTFPDRQGMGLACVIDAASAARVVTSSTTR